MQPVRSAQLRQNKDIDPAPRADQRAKGPPRSRGPGRRHRPIWRSSCRRRSNRPYSGLGIHVSTGGQRPTSTHDWQSRGDEQMGLASVSITVATFQAEGFGSVASLAVAEWLERVWGAITATELPRRQNHGRSWIAPRRLFCRRCRAVKLLAQGSRSLADGDNLPAPELIAQEIVGTWRRLSCSPISPSPISASSETRRAAS